VAGSERTPFFVGLPASCSKGRRSKPPCAHQYTGRKYKRVVALLDEHYDDLWVGGKASYRLGPVIEEDGALIIFAPQLTTISETHGALIKRYVMPRWSVSGSWYHSRKNCSRISAWRLTLPT